MEPVAEAQRNSKRSGLDMHRTLSIGEDTVVMRCNVEYTIAAQESVEA